MENNNNNNIQKEQSKFDITTRTGEVLKLDKNTVEQYIAGGQKITNSEFTMFFQLCKVHHVNPFLKEAYLIKYGDSPATIVLDYKVLQQMADEHPQFKGMKTGVLVVDKDGNEKEREGSYVLSNETLVAGWCEVTRKDREYPTKVYAMFDEFKQINKKTGDLNSNWKSKPIFMITKVAKAQALREAFPNAFGSNIYSKEEADMFEKPNKDFINANVDEVNDKVKNDVATEEISARFDDYDDVTGEINSSNNSGDIYD